MRDWLPRVVAVWLGRWVQCTCLLVTPHSRQSRLTRGRSWREDECPHGPGSLTCPSAGWKAWAKKKNRKSVTSGGSRNWQTGEGGTDFFKKIYTPQSSILWRGSGTYAPQEKNKIWGLKWSILEHISAQIWPFLSFCDPEWEAAF